MRVPVEEAAAAAGAAAAEAAGGRAAFARLSTHGVELRASGGLGKISWQHLLRHMWTFCNSPTTIMLL